MRPQTDNVEHLDVPPLEDALFAAPPSLDGTDVTPTPDGALPVRQLPRVLRFADRVRGRDRRRAAAALSHPSAGTGNTDDPFAAVLRELAPAETTALRRAVESDTVLFDHVMRARARAEMLHQVGAIAALAVMLALVTLWRDVLLNLLDAAPPAWLADIAGDHADMALFAGGVVAIVAVWGLLAVGFTGLGRMLMLRAIGDGIIGIVGCVFAVIGMLALQGTNVVLALAACGIGGLTIAIVRQSLRFRT